VLDVDKVIPGIREVYDTRIVVQDPRQAAESQPVDRSPWGWRVCLNKRAFAQGFEGVLRMPGIETNVRAVFFGSISPFGGREVWQKWLADLLKDSIF
jgi:hypothetical protein